MQRILLVAACSVIFLTTGGCYRRIVGDSWGKFRELAPSPRLGPRHGTRRTETVRAGQDEDAWTIVLATFDGADAEHRASELTGRRQLSYVPDLWTKKQDQQVYVLRGQYADPTSSAAQRDLQQTRMVPLDGARPFAAAEIVHIRGLMAATAKTDSLDLRQYRGQWPYTLQVAVFDGNYRGDRRRAAERHAADLRKKGHQAFYCHDEGSDMSVVTVGLFSDGDRVKHTTTLPSGREMVQAVYGPRIKALQMQFPYNRVNGEIFHEPTVTGKRRPQRSSLIPIK